MTAWYAKKMERVRLESMSDERVLEGVEGLVARSNEVTAELLVYLAEVDRRGLYLREATGSMFAFCVERLHMSEGAAGKRITAARTARRFPVIFELIARGEIHLTAVTLLAPHLREENHVELLARARHRSKREIEKLVAEIAPKPDVASRVAALPNRAASPSATAAERDPAEERDVGSEHAPTMKWPRGQDASVPPPSQTERRSYAGSASVGLSHSTIRARGAVMEIRRRRRIRGDVVEPSQWLRTHPGRVAVAASGQPILGESTQDSVRG